MHVVILAAGKGTRMKSSRPKVLHTLAGRTLIDHVLRTVDVLRVDSVTVVLGHGAEEVRAALGRRPAVQTAIQNQQRGTGHALLQAESCLAGKSGDVLLLYANVPLLQAATLARLVEHHRGSKAAATVLATDLREPDGDGRIVRDEAVYCFELGPLFALLHQLAADNAQSDHDLTDLVSLYRQRKLKVERLAIESAAELRSVNSRVDLAELARVLRDRKNTSLMREGVTLEDPPSTFIDADVAIGADTIIGPGVLLEGSTSLGERCRVHAGCRLTDVQVGDDVTVLDHSVLVESRVDNGARIGPFAHLRPSSVVGEGAHVGNFVELKKTSLGRGSKANHLAYLGDATIGEKVNVGAGTITCNYDGVKKHPTVIDDGAFIGSDSQLIAPVRIGAGAYVAAGSSITKDVPADALAVARVHQDNKPGWAARRRERNAKGHA